MHEAGIIEEMLRQAEDSARSAGCTAIHRIVLRVGAFSSAVPEALEFAFQSLKAGTPAAAARLEIQRVPAVAWCGNCQGEFAADDAVCLCPGCGGVSGELRQGFELDLIRLEAE